MIHSFLQPALIVLAGYLLGSIPSGKIAGWLRGVDIQKEGSGNIGFANAYQVLGKKPAFVVLAADILKGYLPAYCAFLYFSLPVAIAAGAAAILGHVFPLWLRFRGGKAVATSVGVLLAIAPPLALAGFLGWTAVLILTRYMALAAIGGAWTIAITAAAAPASRPYAPLTLLLAIVITFLHRSNLRRLAEGREDRPRSRPDRS